MGHNAPCDTSGFTSKQLDFAFECHSLLRESSDERCSNISAGNASQISTNVNINPFLVSSNPSSQTSSPQQFCNPKSNNLDAPHLAKDSSMNQI